MGILRIKLQGVTYNRVTDTPKLGDVVFSTQQLSELLCGGPAMGGHTRVPTLWRPEGDVEAQDVVKVEWVGEIDVGLGDNTIAFTAGSTTFGFSAKECWVIRGLGRKSPDDRSYMQHPMPDHPQQFHACPCRGNGQNRANIYR